jgi:hypothetical protein
MKVKEAGLSVGARQGDLGEQHVGVAIPGIAETAEEWGFF